MDTIDPDKLEERKLCLHKFTFTLHYRTTFWILLALSVFSCIRVYNLDCRDCVNYSGGNSAVPGAYKYRDCCIRSNYTISMIPDQNRVDLLVAQRERNDKGEPYEYHTYYQKVWFVLFFQAMFFHFAHCLWTVNERGTKGFTKRLAHNLPNAHNLSEAEKAEEIRKTIQFFEFCEGVHVSYYVKLVLCEMLNFVHIIAQILFTHLFIGGHFFNYGSALLKFKLGFSDVDPMESVFPTVTLCNIVQITSPLGLEDVDIFTNHPGTCNLPLNVFYGIIYLFLWFWFLLVLIYSVGVVVLRFSFIVAPSFGLQKLEMIRDSERIDVIGTVVRHCGISDLHFLVKLEKYLKPNIFEELLKELAVKITELYEKNNNDDFLELF